jgi:DNA invertase Pin-like site-specific DNA recombinase
MIVVAEYFRVSKKDEERGISIEVQQEAVRRWVQHNVPDAVLLPPYVDDGRSAYAENIANRPRFQQLIADARAKQFTHIVAYKYDRIARKNSVFFPFLAEMERLNITVVSATESNDWMMSSISGIFAEHFSRMLSARMTDVKRFDAQRGRWVGAVPFGYDRVDGKLIPNGDAWIVQLIFELYTSNGYAIMDIVDELKARGLERRSACHNDGEPYPIGSQSVRQILMNAVYIGQVRCGDITVEGAHAAVVDRAIWEAAQEIRARRNQHGGRLTIQAPDCGILTGIARCAVCGSAMWHMRSGKNRQQTYVCKGLLRLHACDNGRAHVPDVDRYALHVLSRIELPADWQHQALALIHTDRRPAQPDVAQLERERRKLREQFVSGLITLDQFQRQEATLNAQAIERPPPAVLDLERAAARLADFAALLEHATTDEQRAIMSTLFSEVWLRSSVIEAWAPREVYRPLFAVLYDEKRRGGRPSPAAFSPYPVLWASLNQPLVFGGAA